MKHQKQQQAYSNSMKQSIRNMMLCFFTSVLLLACTASIRETEQAIEQIRQGFVPDKRVAIFDVVAKPSGAAVVLRGETNLLAAKRALLQHMDSLKIKCIDSVTILPTPELEGQTYGVVNVSVCNIRSNPKHAAELATQALLGTSLKVLKKEGNWYKIQTPDHYLGWLDPAGFTLMDSSSYQVWKSKPKIVYAKEYGFALEQPSPQANKIADLVYGAILVLEKVEAGFSVVRFPDGRLGYIPDVETYSYDKWLSLEQPSVDNILNTAMEYLGRPYLWGGTSGKAMDCSGFTKTIFYRHGMMLPRDASQQVHIGTEIAYDTTWQNLLPGDFLFFGQRATTAQKEKINHVALYLGEGKIIHASGDANIVIESLKRGDSNFNLARFNTFVRAKRMLDKVGSNGVQMLRSIEGY